MALSGSITTGYWTSSDSGQTRGYTLSWTATQSIANNQSTISWTLSTAGTYPYTVAERTLYVVLAGNVLVNKTDRVMRSKGTVASGSFTVGHASDGTFGFTGSIQAAVYTSSVNCTGSESWSLNNIPRQANITSAPNFNDEQNPTITYSNPAGTAVTSLQACISLTGAKSDIAYRDISKTGTSYTFNLTEAERNVLRNATLSGSNSRTVVFYVRTEIGGNTFYSTSSKTFTVVNNKPTIEPTVKDINSKTLAITNDENVFIRYHSNAEVSVNAKAYKNASITARKVICGSQNIATDTGVISNVDSGNFVFSATDNRGNTVSDSKQVTFIEYIKLTCDLQAKTPTTEGNLSFAVAGNYYNNSFGTTDNVLVVEYCYSENGGEYSEWIALDGVTFADNKYSVSVIIEGLDYRSSYVVKARATDKLMVAQTESKSLKAIPVCDWGEHDFNFNVPLNIQGEPLFDYVVEQGVSGIWAYRKWHSGFAECWGQYSAKIPINTSVGNCFRSESQFVALPFQFYAMRLWVDCTDVNAWASVSASTTSQVSFAFWRSSSHGEYTWYANLHVIGRWK